MDVCQHHVDSEKFLRLTKDKPISACFHHREPGCWWESGGQPCCYHSSAAQRCCYFSYQHQHKQFTMLWKREKRHKWVKLPTDTSACKLNDLLCCLSSGVWVCSRVCSFKAQVKTRGFKMVNYHFVHIFFLPCISAL